MKATIVGAGAIGGWIAGLLVNAGWDVSLLARGAALEQLERNGLRVRRKSDECRYDLAVSADPQKLGKCDVVVIAVKGQNVQDVAPSVAGLCGPETMVVPAINGVPWWFFDVKGAPLSGTGLTSVDPGGVTARHIPASRVVGCVVHASTFTPEPGMVVVNGEDRLIFGEPDGTVSARVEMLAKAVTHLPLRGIASNNIRADIWTKLWGNMTMNPLSVLTMAETGTMLDDPDVRGLVRSMMLEMQTLGTKIGLPLDMTPDERMAVTRTLGSFKTSMLRDAETGRAIEIDPILGALVEIADAVAIPVPNIKTVLGLLRVRAKAIGT